MNFIESARAALPLDSHALREGALARFAAQGMPGPSLESWHYSDWRAIAEAAYAAAAGAAAPEFSLDAVRTLSLRALTSDTELISFALDDLNRALAHEGVVETFSNENALPYLLVQQVGSADAMRHLRHRISLTENACATLLLWDAPSDANTNTLLTSVLKLELARGSRLTLIRLQDSGAQAVRALHIAATVGADATLEIIQLDLGGQRIRQELDIHLSAPGASFTHAGLVAIGGRSHVDNRSHIWHDAPHTTSRTDSRLLAAGKARAILNAKVQVQPGAAKSDSETRVASLLLSGTAEIDAKPELEIYADDVKCAHGASFGQLDEEASFYLRSRGVGAAEAQGLLTLAFAQSTLDRLPLPGLKAWAEQRVSALLAEQLS